MEQLPQRWEERALRWLLAAGAAAALVVALVVAFSTTVNRHPDEIMHLDVVSYFAEHLAPPPLNADGLRYGPDGWSRVYNGEAVYWIYGRVVALARLLSGAVDAVAGTELTQQLHLPYNPLARLLNIGLLAATLGALFVTARRHPIAAVIGLAMLATPQVIYLYAYVNSDAWGLSSVIFLTCFLLSRGDLLARPADGVWLGVLGSLIVLSKEPFWLSLPFVGALGLCRAWPRLAGAGRPTALRAIGLMLLVAAALVAPLKVLYPLSQGDFAAGALAMREQRAWEGFKPSNITQGFFHMADRGVPFSEVLGYSWWYDMTARSYFGLFGYLNVPLAPWHYWLGAAAALLGLAATLLAVGRGWWRGQPLALRALLAAAPLTLALCVAASLYHSWTFDVQPQGRYLFGAMPAVAVMVGGLGAGEPAWLARLRLAAWLALIALSLGALAVLLPGNPLLD